MPNRRPTLVARFLLSLVVASLGTAAIAADLPRQAPELIINLTSRNQIRLSEYKGKVVLVCFFLTTCPHCQRTLGYLIKDQTDYGPRGFQVLASAIQEGAALAVPGFIQSFRPTFPVGYGDPTAAIYFMQHPPMLVPHAPLLAFIDRQGNIRAQFEGDDPKLMNNPDQDKNLRAQIEALLNEGTAPAKKSAPKKTAPR